MMKDSSLGKSSVFNDVCMGLAVIVLAWGMAIPAMAVPSFSRQTGMSCMACHTVFPELTAYGRWFKLNGYVSGEADKVTEKDDKTGDVSLEILKGTPLSAMIQITDTFVQKNSIAAPGPAAGDDGMGVVGFPEQLSLFYAGEITPNVGAFAQMTYDFQSGVLHSDNTDIRYTTHFDMNGRDGIFGLTLNNNPTVEDVYNSTPAWGYPYSTSATVPKPETAPQITTLGGSVAGLGAYVSLDKLLYVEATAYRSAPQGGSVPSEVIQGYAPYLRMALSQEVDDHSFELGGFAMMENGEPTFADAVNITMTGIPSGYKADYFEDWGADAQYQYTTKDHQFSAQACWIREYQTWNSTFNTNDGTNFGSQNLNDQLELFKANLTYYYQRQIGFTLGYFGMGGSTDYSLYANGNPETQGMVYEINFAPWLNTKFTLQYTQYFYFNGGGTDTYDGVNYAKDNNTAMAMAWFAY
jgi:hypothetical protein